MEVSGDWMQAVQPVVDDIHARLSAAKLKPLTRPLLEQLGAHNAQVEPRLTPEHNDPHRLEWTDLPAIGMPNVLVGRDVELLVVDTAASNDPTNGPYYYYRRRPLAAGGQYDSDEYGPQISEEFRADLCAIWSNAILKELGVPQRELSGCRAVLIIPDLHHPPTVEAMVDVLLNDLGFQAVAVQQESLCATFGAGSTFGCVVHVGPQRTTVACVEDGSIINESK
jgi:actin-related protein 8